VLRVVLNASALRVPLTGTGQYTLHLAQGLAARQDLQTEFFYGRHLSEQVETHPSVVASGALRAWVRDRIPYAYAIKRALEQHHFDRGRGRHDLYHEPNTLPLRFDGPTIVTVHDLSWIRFPETHPVQRVRALNRYVEPALRQASLILTDSEFTRRELIEVFGLAESGVRTIALGLDSAFVPMDASGTREVLGRHGLAHGEYFIFSGTLEPRKNLRTAIDAHAGLAKEMRLRHPLVLAGMKGWRESPLERLLEQPVRRGEIRVLGYVPRGELAVLTAGALAMVYPSLYEGFGLPPLEAMGCGVPPITSNAASLPEVVGDAGITVAPLDTAALAEAMRSLASDAALRARLSGLALARSSQFTWEQCVEQTVLAYRQVATGREAA